MQSTRQILNSAVDVAFSRPSRPSPASQVPSQLSYTSISPSETSVSLRFRMPTKTATTMKRTSQSGNGTSALRTQARMRRARVLGHSASVNRVDSSRLAKARLLQDTRTRCRSQASIPECLPQPALQEVCPHMLAVAGLDPLMEDIGGAQMRRLLQPLSDEYVT